MIGPSSISAPIWRKWARQPAGLFGFLIVLLLLGTVLAAPFVATHNFAQQDIPARLQGPSTQHFFGTDHLGRDVFSRLVYGTRTAFETALPGILIALCVGLLLGIGAGYTGSWVESFVLVMTDTLQAFPSILFALALLALIGPSTASVITVIAIAFAPGYARVVRALVLSLKTQPFIEVTRALGASHTRIILAHLLPNMLAPLIILLAMDLASAITIEAGLSFLGLGVKPPTPSWGVVLADGFGRIRQSPWPVLFASLALALSSFGLTVFGEALRDTLDPRTAIRR